MADMGTDWRSQRKQGGQLEALPSGRDRARTRRGQWREARFLSRLNMLPVAQVDTKSHGEEDCCPFFSPAPTMLPPSAGLTVQMSLEGSLLVLLLDVCMQNTHAHTHTLTHTLTYVHTPALTHTFPPINEFVLLSLMQTYTYIFFKWYISELSVLSHPYNDVSKCLLGSGHVWALFPAFSHDNALSPIVNPGRL